MDYLRCDGTLTVDALGQPSCDLWVLMPQDELLSLAPVTQLVELLQVLVAQPTPGEIGGAFMAAFTLPMAGYLVSFGYQSVIGFFNVKDEN